MAHLKRKKICLFLLHAVVAAGPIAAEATLTFQEAEELYLSRNPAVEAERQRIEMARGALRQARLLPNPQLNYSQESFPLSSEDASFWNDQEWIFWATQKLELGGKRRHRADVARLGVRIAEAQFEDFVRIGNSEVREAFAEAYFAQEKRHLALEQLDFYQRIRDIHRKRLQEGDVSGLSQLRIDLEEIRFMKAASEAETAFVSAWSKLAALIGWSETSIPELRLEPLPTLAETSLQDLLRAAEEVRPDLEAFSIRQDQMEESLRLEKSQRIPDLTLGGGYKRDFGAHSFYAAVQFPLPLFDRNQGAVYEAQARRRRVQNQYLWKRLEIRSEVERAFRNYQTWRVNVERLQEDTLRRAERVLEITQQSYQEGEASLTDYLDTLRVRLEASLSFYDLLLQLEKARIELEKAVGAELR